MRPRAGPRIAAIDVGSNAMRFVAAELGAEPGRTLLDQARLPVRLGHEVFVTGKLNARAMERARRAFRAIARRLEQLEIDRYRAIATSAVREATNGEEFIERVRQETGIELEVITGAEEARLVYQAVRERLDLGRGTWVLVDLGGGSVEVSLIDSGGIRWSETHNMGSVRLLEELGDAMNDPARFRLLLAEYTGTLRIPSASQHFSPVGMIATGGNIEALARLISDNDARVDMIEVPDLRRVLARLAELTYDERREQLGLRPDRADVILPAGMVYERLCQLSRVERVHVPGVGVKEGLILDIAQELAAGPERRERLDRDATDAAIALGRHYMFDEAHGLHVARLAASLFDGIREIHGLSAVDRRMLVAAAVLHDIGQFVSYQRHHKHALYLISHSELSGFKPREIAIIANVARYHRKAHPAADHEPFAELPREAQNRVTRLAALLRIADALDREHLQRVRSLEVIAHDDAIVLEVDASGDLLLERWALERKSRLFEETFGRSVELR